MTSEQGYSVINIIDGTAVRRLITGNMCRRVVVLLSTR